MYANLETERLLAIQTNKSRKYKFKSRNTFRKYKELDIHSSKFIDSIMKIIHLFYVYLTKLGDLETNRLLQKKSEYNRIFAFTSYFFNFFNKVTSLPAYLFRSDHNGLNKT